MEWYTSTTYDPGHTFYKFFPGYTAATRPFFYLGMDRFDYYGSTFDVQKNGVWCHGDENGHITFANPLPEVQVKSTEPYKWMYVKPFVNYKTSAGNNLVHVGVGGVLGSDSENGSNIQQNSIGNQISFLLNSTQGIMTKLLVNEYKRRANVIDIAKDIKSVSKLGKVSVALDVASVISDVASANVQSSTVTDVAMIAVGIGVGVAIGPITACVVGGVYGFTMLAGGQTAINNAFNGNWNSSINNGIKSIYKNF